MAVGWISFNVAHSENDRNRRVRISTWSTGRMANWRVSRISTLSTVRMTQTGGGGGQDFNMVHSENDTNREIKISTWSALRMADTGGSGLQHGPP